MCLSHTCGIIGCLVCAVKRNIEKNSDLSHSIEKPDEFFHIPSTDDSAEVILLLMSSVRCSVFVVLFSLSGLFIVFTVSTMFIDKCCRVELWTSVNLN